MKPIMCFMCSVSISEIIFYLPILASLFIFIFFTHTLSGLFRLGMLPQSARLFY